ncbi:MAG: hypothetical protein HOV81_14915 [Kofleriaceae bacterium]|nr:hypothetical protein [Kofleriaceae bacterium]
MKCRSGEVHEVEISRRHWNLEQRLELAAIIAGRPALRHTSARLCNERDQPATRLEPAPQQTRECIELLHF